MSLFCIHATRSGIYVVFFFLFWIQFSLLLGLSCVLVLFSYLSVGSLC